MIRELVLACEPRCCPLCLAQGRRWRGHGWRTRKISRPGCAVSSLSPCHRLRCYTCRTVWIVRPVQILRYRRYEASEIAPVFEARGAGLSWWALDRQFPEISVSTQRSWVQGLLVGLPLLLSKLASWAAKTIPEWLPPSKLNQGGLPALLSVVASLQEWKVCPADWLEWLQAWTYQEGPGYLILATRCHRGRDP